MARGKIKIFLGPVFWARHWSARGKRVPARRRFLPRPNLLKAVSRFACHCTPKWLAPRPPPQTPAAASGARGKRYSRATPLFPGRIAASYWIMAIIEIAIAIEIAIDRNNLEIRPRYRYRPRHRFTHPHPHPLTHPRLSHSDPSRQRLSAFQPFGSCIHSLFEVCRNKRLG